MFVLLSWGHLLHFCPICRVIDARHPATLRAQTLSGEPLSKPSSAISDL